MTTSHYETYWLRFSRLNFAPPGEVFCPSWSITLQVLSKFIKSGSCNQSIRQYYPVFMRQKYLCHIKTFQGGLRYPGVFHISQIQKRKPLYVHAYQAVPGNKNVIRVIIRYAPDHDSGRGSILKRVLMNNCLLHRKLLQKLGTNIFFKFYRIGWRKGEIRY